MANDSEKTGSAQPGAASATPKKRLFVAQVELEFVVYAADKAEAAELAYEAFRDDATMDLYESDFYVRPLIAKDGKFYYPGGYSKNSLVYGTDDDRSLKELADEEIAALPPPLVKARSCNMHEDCDAVDGAWRAAHPGAPDDVGHVHCRDEDCEDCFPK